mmetsp:Transcript_13821/g.13403  ORF Transcript_13821/g.13403 Transcript_13821/m.13403 type:complete len:205 (+) Transcript_13821:414-1028(+)
MEVSPQRRTIYFSATMWTVASNLLRLSLCSLPTKSSIRKTFLFCVAITSVLESTVYTDSTTSVAVVIVSNCGKPFATLLIAFLVVPSLTIKSFVCMEGLVQNSVRWNKSPILPDLAMFQIQAYSVIFCGRIPTLRLLDGVKMIEACLSHLAVTSFANFFAVTTWILSYVLIRWSKTDMNFLQDVNLSLSSRHLTTVASLTMQVR